MSKVMFAYGPELVAELLPVMELTARYRGSDRGLDGTGASGPGIVTFWFRLISCFPFWSLLSGNRPPSPLELCKILKAKG